MKLTETQFKEIVKNAPLVSIDLLVSQCDKYLVGLRNNRPAKGKYFVPGGRIFKDEKMADAFQRIVHDELGITKSIEDALFVNVVEHHYSDSMFDESVTTHYVVLVYEINLMVHESVKLDAQHKSFKWISEADILKHKDIHSLTRNHFPIKKDEIKLLSYYDSVLNQLKFYNTIVWAFPTAYLAVLYFSIEKAKDSAYLLLILLIFSSGLLFVFYKHVANQKAIIILIQTLERKIKTKYGSDYVPVFNGSRFKTTTIMLCVLTFGTVAIFLKLLIKG